MGREDVVFCFLCWLLQKKISEKWASCEAKIEEIPLAAKSFASYSLAGGYQECKYFFQLFRLQELVSM